MRIDAEVYTVLCELRGAFVEIRYQRLSEKELDIAIKRLIRTLCENGEILDRAIDLLEQVQDKESGIQDKIRSIDKDVAETSAQLLMLTQLQR